MFNHKNNGFYFRKTIIVVLVFVMLFSNIMMPRPAHAQFAEIGQAIWNAFKIPFDIYDKLEKSYGKIIKTKGAVIYKQALSRVLHNLAVESANWAATGFKGQAPLFYTQPGKYLEQTGNAELGNYLNNELKDTWGVDFCKPLDPMVKLKVEIGAKEYFEQSTPNCKWTDIRNNVSKMKFLDTKDLQSFSDIFNPNANQLGIVTNVTTLAMQKKTKKESAEHMKILLSDGWKAVTAKVSGWVKTPASTVEKKVQKDLVEDTSKAEQTYTGELLADFMGTFTSTLVSKVMQNVIQKGLSQPGDDTSSAPNINMPTASNANYNSSYTTINKSPKQAARERFADIGRPNYIFGGPFNLITQLSCNNNSTDTETQYNCVIDEALSSAILQMPHLTVRQALDRKLLHGDWPFGFRADKSGGTATVDKGIYSYRTLVILRKYRILPVGWELAAAYYGRYDKSGQALTLNKLIKDYGNTNSPYYRLVDPNWVLKAPETICEKQGFGEVLSKEKIEYQVDLNQDGDTDDKGEHVSLPIRLPYCADERSCIQERDDGNGCLYYGYCTEEKPIWRIQSNGDGSCDALYNSCRVYTNRLGQQVAYLNNTVWGKDVCNSANVGCRKYSRVWDNVNNTWSTDEHDEIYLNQQASNRKCSENEVGCTRFIDLERDAIFLTDSDGATYDYKTALTALQNGEAFDNVINYDNSTRTKLRKAPDYLSCEGYTAIVSGDKNDCNSSNFWRNDINKCVVSGNDKCAEYALYCAADDVGCKFYTPKSYEGPQVPGVVSDDDYCPAECVGYKDYLEQPTFLEPTIPIGRNPVSLIAKTGTSCSAADNGCEEFTNLSEGTEGENKEYFSSIRSCILPNNTGVATYYSWASTDEAGNQLKNWQLLATNADGTGMPCTNSKTAADGTVSCVDNTTDPNTGLVYTPYQCSFGNPDVNLNPVYNPDCVEYTDNTGQSYWMLYSRVIPTSEGCVPMRRTNGGDIYSINQEQSQRCGEQAKNCRQYKGSAANNVKTILSDDFEDGTNQGWQAGEISTEALTAGGHSYHLLDGENIYKDVTDLIHTGKSYKLSFWAKGDGDIIEKISFIGEGNVSSEFIFDSIQVTDDWNRYEVDLNNLHREITDNEQLEFEYGGDNLYLDNIILTETQDDLYLIKDSWQTPASCDDPTQGAMVGCEAYQDVNKENWYLKSFTRLCNDEVIGCEAMVDTYNNSEVNELSYNNTAESDPYNNFQDDVTVPADDLKYLVYDRNKLCKQVGCMALGLSEKHRQGEDTYSNQYLVVDAQGFGHSGVGDNQANSLCLVAENGCDEFTQIDGSNSIDYFMDPTVFTCEYKAVNGNYGWYMSGENIICPMLNIDDGLTGHCLGGRSVLNDDIDNSCQQASDCADYATRSQPGRCSQWVGLCPVGQNNCTEYQDPANPEDCDKQSVYGEAYNPAYNNNIACDFYYYKSDKVEGENSGNNCTENDLGKTCRAFHRTDGGPNQWYSTPRCSGDQQVGCEIDADCVDANGNSLGTCSYTGLAAPAQYDENANNGIDSPVEQEHYVQ